VPVVVHQQGDVIAPLTRRWQVDGEHVEAKEQVFAERAAALKNTFICWQEKKAIQCWGVRGKQRMWEGAFH